MASPEPAICPMKSPWRIKPLHVPELPALIELGDEPLTIGRDPANAVRVPATSYPSVSTHHARVALVGSDIVVEDLGSTNGTLVNGQPIARALLATGDTFQLGADGPRFVAIQIPRFARETETGGEGLGATKFVSLDAFSEVPLESPKAPATRTRRIANAIGALGLLTTAVFAWSVVLRGEGHASQEALVAIGAEQQTSLQRILEEAELRLRSTEGDVLAHVTRNDELWREQQRDLRAERDRLQEQVASIETSVGITPQELRQLRDQLSETQVSLQEYRSGSRESTALADVARVRRSVVLIEKRIVYRDQESGRYLHVSNDPGAASPLNLEGRGRLVSMDASTGSGFVVSSDGWILTNAHVLAFSEEIPPIGVGAGVMLEPEERIEVVFNETDVRHRAGVVDMVADNGLDLGLIKIKPFASMAYLEGFTTEVARVEPGSGVYLFGFPLGNHALQQGDTVVASTFKGILSRNVADYMQVDAGVYPGNSGGPLTDASGRVIGIVFSVQNNLDGTTAAGIGYAMPISAAAAIWPPKQD